MTSIGIRELRQQASKYIHMVENGETIEVTDHGRPVALLTPIEQSSAIHNLAQRGRLDLAKGDLSDLGPPLPQTPGVPVPSEVLAKARENER